MSDYDDDNIEFDFFEEPAPEPEPKRGLQRRPRRPDGPSRPPVRPSTGMVPLLRLLLLIAAAIGVVLLIVEIGGCSSTSGAYKHYLGADGVAPVATQSQQEGKDLGAMLAQGSLTEATVERTLGGLVTTADKLLQQAQSLDPPGPLREQHRAILDSLTLRRKGLNGLLTIFKQTAHDKKNDKVDALFGQETARFAASDVIWADLFQSASTDILERHGVRGVPPPGSVFLAKKTALDATSLANLWRRIHGSAVSSNTLRGTALVGLRIAPTGDHKDGVAIAASGPTIVRETVGMAFIVSVKDTGAIQEANVKVRVHLGQQGFQTVTGTIPVINPGETRTVKIDMGATPIFDVPLKLDVSIASVPHEASLANNSHQYTVTFHV